MNLTVYTVYGVCEQSLRSQSRAHVSPEESTVFIVLYWFLYTICFVDFDACYTLTSFLTSWKSFCLQTHGKIHTNVEVHVPFSSLKNCGVCKHLYPSHIILVHVCFNKVFWYDHILLSYVCVDVLWCRCQMYLVHLCWLILCPDVRSICQTTVAILW